MEILEYTFFRNALLGLMLISVASAVIGTYVIVRRLMFVSGGVTHACFGGLGLGYYLGMNPLLMAGVFAVGSSLGVEWVSTRYHVREDSAISVVWALGMAIGVLFIFLTPGYVPELNNFLFGSILCCGIFLSHFLKLHLGFLNLLPYISCLLIKVSRFRRFEILPFIIYSIRRYGKLKVVVLFLWSIRYNFMSQSHQF